MLASAFRSVRGKWSIGSLQAKGQTLHLTPPGKALRTFQQVRGNGPGGEKRPGGGKGGIERVGGGSAGNGEVYNPSNEPD